MYTRLFEEMMAWYARRKVHPSYLRGYAQITMSVLAFLNVNSLLLIGIRMNVDIAKRIFAVERFFPASGMLAAVLLIAHIITFRSGKVTSPDTKRHSDMRSASGFIAAAYLIISFALVLYATRWAPVIS